MLVAIILETCVNLFLLTSIQIHYYTFFVSVFLWALLIFYHYRKTDAFVYLRGLKSNLFGKKYWWLWGLRFEKYVIMLLYHNGRSLGSELGSWLSYFFLKKKISSPLELGWYTKFLLVCPLNLQFRYSHFWEVVLVLFLNVNL